MKRLPLLILSLTLLCAVPAIAQNPSSGANSNPLAANAGKSKKRGPVFRATADQIKQAQSILKQRNFYSGEDSGKLSPDTRASLKLYQGAEGLKVTGTLNKATLEKMGIALTDKQKTM